MSDRVDQLKEIVRYGVKLNVQVPRSVFNTNTESFKEFQESLKELQKDPQLIVTITERPPLINHASGYFEDENNYNDIIIQRKQYED